MTDIGLYTLVDDHVVFSFKAMGRAVSGPEEALQIVAYHLFQSPGSNAFDTVEGGGLLDLVGSQKPKAELLTDATIALNKAMTNIRRTQSHDKTAESTVTGLQLLDLKLLTDSQTIDLSIRIDLLDGNSFRATFQVP